MDILIIGGNAMGMSMASKLRRNKADVNIIVLEKTDIISFGACGLPYYIGDYFDDNTKMLARSFEHFKKSNIDVRLNHEALSLDASQKKVSVKNTKTGDISDFAYDKLLISTGAKPFIPNIDGINLKGIYPVTKMSDGLNIKSSLDKAKNVVIIGAGFIGLEVADAMLKMKKNVTIIEKQEHVSQNIFDTEIIEHLETAIVDCNINLKLGETVQGFEGKDGVQKVVTDKGSYDADLVILSVGFIPNTEWCKDSGIKTLANNAIIIDEYCQTSIEDIYSGGDCATVKHATFWQDSYIPLATTANKLGRVLADVLASKDTRFQGTLGTSGLKFMDFEIAKTGLSEGEAKKLNINYSTNMIKSINHTHYVPNGMGEIYIKIVYDKATRVLLGAQICGANGSVMRINAMSVCIFKKMTVDELGMMDFVYTPPFSMTWDALNIVGSTAK